MLIAFKFIKPKDVGLSGGQARKLSENALYQLPEIVKPMEDGKKQVKA